MKFAPSEDQALLQRATRDFLARECPLEKTRRLIEHDPRGYDPTLWGHLAEMGYLGLVLPPAVGGQGLGPVELALVCEEMGRICAPGPFLDATLAAAVLTAAGGQEALLREIVAGTTLVTTAEHDALFTGRASATTRLVGGRVRGTKYLVPFAAVADALVVTTTDGPALVRGPFAATPLPTLDPAARFAAVELDHPATLLGSPALVESVGRLGAVAAGAMLLGLMGRALEMTLDYVRTRQAFRRPIGAFQSLQHRMADMLLKNESTRSAVYRAAWCLATDDEATPLACATAKAWAGDAARHVCGEAIQMHGGIGFTWELDLHLYFKRAKTLEQQYGATEAQIGMALAAAGL